MSVVRALAVSSFVVTTVLLANACTGDNPDLAGSEAPAADAATPPASSDGGGDASSPSAEEACKAKLPASRACYTGPEGTRGKGTCKDGELECHADGVTACAGEVLPAPADVCNDLDDDCNGVVDDGINKKTSPIHCGACNAPCAADEACGNGVCHKRSETSCADGVDNDMDGDADCGDDECEQQSCGAGCLCASKLKVETDCGDGLDNDGDTMADCADTDCTTCGTGCTCTAGKKVEANCADGVDNDKDAMQDCADPDCNGKSCGNGCTCGNNEKKEVTCNDGVDNDGDGKRDCADSDCAGKACTKSGGLIGTCVNGLCN